MSEEAGPSDTVHRLRDLPGVQRVTELCQNPRLWEYPALSSTMAEVDDIAVALFGVPKWALEWIDEIGDDPEEKANWEAAFKVCDMPFKEAERFWHLLGWDVSDGKGGELISAHWFMRQIVALARDLDEDVKFTPDGSGQWPASDEDDEADEGVRAERLKASLQADADAFLARRGGDVT